MYVFFTVPEGQSSAILSLKAGKGSSDVFFDDVRIARSERKAVPDSIYFAEDFEHIPDGLYPFIKGPAGGINDPRTHLAELHEPYTQRGWNGKVIDDVISGNWSIKVHGEPAGLMLQTIPQTVRFVAGETYTVSFKYEAMGPDYALVFGEDDEVNFSVTLKEATIPTDCTFSFVAGKSGNSWFGIAKLNDSETDMVLDDLVITVNEDSNKPTTVNDSLPAKANTWKGFEKFSFNFEGMQAWLVKPAVPLAGNPWVWKAMFFDWHAEMDSILLSEGFFIAYVDAVDMFGSPRAMGIWDRYYDFLTVNHKDLGKNLPVALLGGGQFVVEDHNVT